jgi:hypothetical protein
MGALEPVVGSTGGRQEPNKKTCGDAH